MDDVSQTFKPFSSSDSGAYVGSKLFKSFDDDHKDTTVAYQRREENAAAQSDVSLISPSPSPTHDGSTIGDSDALIDFGLVEAASGSEN